MNLRWKKLAESLTYGMRMPRKVKKRVLGERLSHCKVKRMLKETTVGPPIRTMFERREFYPHGAFCPKCGCKGYHGTGNATTYPEHCERFYCDRCHNMVGYIDNSPFIHALECKHNDYNPEF